MREMDLLSFDSWEFSGTATVATETTAAEDACSLWTSCSSLDTDAASGAAAAARRPTSSSVVAPGKPHRRSSSSTVHDKNRQPANIQVSVSGVIFSLSPSTFEKMKKLPWKTDDLMQDKHTLFFLPTSPVLFELLLNFMTFQSLPQTSKLTSSDMEEMEILATLLELPELQSHLAKNRQPQLLRLLSATARNNKASTTTKQQHHPSSRKKQQVPSLVQKMQAKLPSFRKATHAEICANSDHLY